MIRLNLSAYFSTQVLGKGRVIAGAGVPGAQRPKAGWLVRIDQCLCPPRPGEQPVSVSLFLIAPAITSFSKLSLFLTFLLCRTTGPRSGMLRGPVAFLTQVAFPGDAQTETFYSPLVRMRSAISRFGR